MALGADRGAILRMVFASGARIAAIGLGIGTAGALALTQVLSGLLFGVSARDPLTFIVVPAARSLPSRSPPAGSQLVARSVEPVIALRGE